MLFCFKVRETCKMPQVSCDQDVHRWKTTKMVKAKHCGTGRKQLGSRVITNQFISKRQSSKHTFISLRLNTVIGALECSFLQKRLQYHFESISFQSTNFLVNRKKKRTFTKNEVISPGHRKYRDKRGPKDTP